MFMHQPKLESEAHAHEGQGSRDCVGKRCFHRRTKETEYGYWGIERLKLIIYMHDSIKNKNKFKK